MRSNTTQPAPRLSTFAHVFSRQRGWSKFQLLAAIAVIAVIVGVAVPRLITAFKHSHHPDVIAAEQNINEINLALQRYHQDNGRYPSNQQGLLALILKPQQAPLAKNWQTGGYIERLPRDPWGHPYQYRLSDDEQQADVFSFGAKGPDEGDDSDSVIHARH
jgi:general secretion pathway protein G